jgi:hypothetical protein
MILPVLPSFSVRRFGALTLLLFALAGLGSCRSRGGDGAPADVGGSPDVPPDAFSPEDVAPDLGPDIDVVTAPDRVARFPSELPFEVSRSGPVGRPPAAAEVEAFTRRMLRFYAATDFFRWTRRHSHGLADSNPWGQPPYLFWWQDTVAVRAGDRVTFRHTGGADNMMSWHGRVFGPVVGAYLTLAGTGEQSVLRELVLGYIRGVSATLTGNVWAGEDPVIDTIMARALFHRNHEWELDGGRKAAVDYDPVRHEESQQRHDTLHNPDNPTWGDVYVRSKRSKDDFPWVYRVQVHLARLLWTSADPEIRDAALTLYDQLQAFSADIVDHGYVIRAKAASGEVFIPYLDGTDTVDDFASMVEFEEVVPNAECNAKLGVALIATGQTLGNDCEDGISEIYEEVAMARYYGHTWMQWGFHVSAVATALLYGAADAAQAMLTGLGARMDELKVRDDAISADPRYKADVAQLLVLGATYGLPLTADEARLVMEEFTLAADHYEPFDRWDLWSADLPDGEYEIYPARESDAAAGPVRTHIWIPEMLNLFEYCASPVRAGGGAPFLDCDLFTRPDLWMPTTCPAWQPPRVVGNLDGSDLVEVSGLAASRVHPGLLWAHNDSGDESRVFAIRLADAAVDGAAPPAEAGTIVTAFALDGVDLSDCEDIAIGPFAGVEGDALFLADTGNNGGGKDVLSVYVFPEPASIDGSAIGNVRRIDVAYPDGTHDCESFFVDPWTGDLYFVVKEYSLPTTKVFRLAAPLADTPATGTALALALVGQFPFQQATGAEMSPDGRVLAVRGYFDGRLFRRQAGQSVADMLASEPCILPSFMDEPYMELQGEAVAFDASGSGLYTVSERLIAPQDIHYTALP